MTIFTYTHIERLPGPEARHLGVRTTEIHGLSAEQVAFIADAHENSNIGDLAMGCIYVAGVKALLQEAEKRSATWRARHEENKGEIDEAAGADVAAMIEKGVLTVGEDGELSTTDEYASKLKWSSPAKTAPAA